MKNFAYFIASYNKPLNITTLNFLNKMNVTYPIYIVVGTDDPQLDLYKETFKNNLIIFDKADYIGKVDNIGYYKKFHTVCTYSRLAVDDYAKKNKIRYVCYLFDDIKDIRIRYINSENRISAITSFDIDKLMDLYVDLLNSSKDIYIVGPPNSSFYIGVDSKKQYQYSTRYGNMMIYDMEKELLPYKANVIEDMSIILYNNVIGRMSICPFGVQVNCREPMATGECYGKMSKYEYYQQWCLILNGKPINLKRPTISYSDFTPKIISEKYKKESKGE